MRQRTFEQKALYEKQGREKVREGDLLHLAGCMLYWGEGAKKTNHVSFINSDPCMIQLFI